MSTEHEQWLPIPGSSAYEVSSHGRVRSRDRQIRNRNGYSTRRGQILSTPLDSSGYAICGITMDGAPAKSFRVNRLVAQVFLNDGEPIDRKLHVDHIDHDPSNNRVANLQLVSSAVNAGRRPPSGRLPLVTRLQILHDRLVVGDSYLAIAARHGLTGSGVQKIVYRFRARWFHDEILSGAYDTEELPGTIDLIAIKDVLGTLKQEEAAKLAAKARAARKAQREKKAAERASRKESK